MNQVRNYSNKERIAVVTGSSKGIGKAIAMEFAKAGYSVVINARNEEELKQAAEDISKSVKDGGKVVSIPTEEAMREQGEQIHPSDVEKPQLRPQTKPKKQTTKTIMKIERSLADASKQIEKQTTQINKINQNLQSLQNQIRAGQRQSELINQIRSQVNQIQKQVSQVQKSIQKRSYAISQKSSKKDIRVRAIKKGNRN